MAMDFRLQPEELEFARRHIQNFYSSDFFPDVPEFDAVWAAWDEVRDYLENRSVENLGQPPLIMAAPKSGGGYRVVHQLHPLDALVYTALARKVAPELEERRSPAEEGIVCSYRINITPNGHFFSENRDGYSTFHENSSILADEKRYVLSLDIAGFYNHIYIHRVQSSRAMPFRLPGPVYGNRGVSA